MSSAFKRCDRAVGFLLAGVTVLATLGWEIAQAADVFGAYRGVSSTSAGSQLGPEAICSFEALSNPLQLREAVERTLCNNPKAAQAWAAIKQQAAALGISRAAYLPSLSTTIQRVRQDNSTDVSSHPELSARYKAFVSTESASLSWVLWDFGGREAALKNASELFSAAQANQDAVLQGLFATVAKDYYSAQAAQGGLTATRDIERTSRESFGAASARADNGIAPISDALQAETAYAQATFNRAKAEGDLAIAQGTLVADMRLRSDFTVTLPAVEEGVQPDAEFMLSVSALLDEAIREHPTVLQAKAQVRAAEAKEQQARSEGLPKLSLVGSYARNDQPAGASLGLPQFPATGKDWSVGLRVEIPIFEGFARGYEIQAARAQTELQAAQLAQVEQQVGIDVWNAYQTLRTDTESVTNSGKLLGLANMSYQATLTRYTSGVGTIVDLLNAQSALAAAQRQRVQALTDWRGARLQLAAKLGTLGIGRLDDTDPRRVSPAHE